MVAEEGKLTLLWGHGHATVDSSTLMYITVALTAHRRLLITKRRDEVGRVMGTRH